MMKATRATKMRPARLAPLAEGRLALDPAAFADEMLPRNEKGQPWSLARHQRRILARALRRDPTGRLLFRILLWSEPKKSGKTLLGSVLGLWWASIIPHTEIIVVANDLEQAVGRVFTSMVQLLTANPELARFVTVRAEKLLFANGTVVRAIAADYKGAAGSRHSLVIFDELWGTMAEAAERLYEELTPPPTEPDAWMLIVSSAGFTGESRLLESLYHRGLAGTRVDDELECYEADGLFTFWSHTPRQPWQTGEAGARYYAEQARILRPTTFRRLHRNEWVSAESSFITPEMWDQCVEQDWAQAEADRELPVWVGVDLGIVNDLAAVVVVTVDEDLVVLLRHTLWRPTKQAPLDIEATVERSLRTLAREFSIQAIYADPYQAHAMLMALQRDGLPARGFAQTEGNVARMGETIYSLLRGRRLVTYPDPDLRQQAMNVVGIESARGVRMAKASASRKVDGIVALAMACCAAADMPVRPPLRLIALGS